MANTHNKKRKKGYHEVDGRARRHAKHTKPFKITQNGRTRELATVGTAATGSRTVQSNARRQLSMLGRLSMCELSVGDERQRSEQDERGQALVRQLEQLNENGIQNEMTGCHRSWNGSWDKHWSELGLSTHTNNKQFLCVRLWRGTCYGRRVLLSSFFLLLLLSPRIAP